MSTTIDRESIVPRSALRYRPVAPVMQTQDDAPSKPRASRARNQQAFHPASDPIRGLPTVGTETLIGSFHR